MIVDGNTYCRVITPILPPEYQEVEYIQSSGTQYIDTGISCNNDTGIEADIQQVSYNTNNWSVWIGSLKTTSDGYWIHLGQASRDRGLRFSWGAGAGTYVYTSISSSDFNRHTYQIDKGELTIDNTTTYTLTNSYEFTTSPSTIVLFADKKGSTITEYSSIKIFYCKLYDNNVLIRNLIPCYRKSDNEIGMYDTVNGVFYTNQGTGTFLKGNNVVHTIRYKIPTEERPYIKGHVTDGSSTFTFTVNTNQSITVPVDSNGNWKWMIDRQITSFKYTFTQKNTIDIVKINYRDNAVDCANIAYNNTCISVFEFNTPISVGTAPFATDKNEVHLKTITATIDESCTTLGYFVRGQSVLEELILKGDTSNVTNYEYFLRLCSSLKTLKIPTVASGSNINSTYALTDATNIENVEIKTVLINMSFKNQSKLTKQSVINIINAAAANVTYTLHSTVYNKCASGGEWYTDVQAAINAKALEGYTVTLISA